LFLANSLQKIGVKVVNDKNNKTRINDIMYLFNVTSPDNAS